jgi:hypothetical protein
MSEAHGSTHVNGQHSLALDLLRDEYRVDGAYEAAFYQLMSNTPGAVVVAAVRQHLDSEQAHIRPTRKHLAPYLEGGAAPKPSAPPVEPVPKGYQLMTIPYLKKPVLVQTTYPGCKECCDSGMAKFWYVPHEYKQVYLRSEWLLMDERQIARLKCSLALCDCRAGLARTEGELDDSGMNYKNRIEKYYKGDFRTLSAYARLEVVRKWAARRQQNEQTTIDF